MRTPRGWNYMVAKLSRPQASLLRRLVEEGGQADVFCQLPTIKALERRGLVTSAYVGMRVDRVKITDEGRWWLDNAEEVE